MKIQVLAFGQILDITQKDSWEEEGILNLNQLQEKLWNDYPALKEISFVFSINKQISKDGALLSDGCEVALLPPFSGG
ncbi:MAG: MoaD/ThiS family protein [Bacteroidia bacterium]|nr:MoaD/ThiS family protein [Bacteroidia bacterium]MCF8425416.1 MoaD/ThiS family protein [Bacteroidia bacterium]MCF8447108.1 MoaD/ThiS family protein [Bacteroidia bacterium]